MPIEMNKATFLIAKNSDGSKRHKYFRPASFLADQLLQMGDRVLAFMENNNSPQKSFGSQLVFEIKHLNNEHKCTQNLPLCQVELGKTNFALASSDEQNQGIVVTGGINAKNRASNSTSILVLETNKLVKFSKLNNARSHHSSLRCNAKVSIFCGRDKEQLLSSIEIIENVRVESNIFKSNPKWQLVLPPSLCPSTIPLTISLGSTKVLVAGGYTYEGMSKKAYIVDVEDPE